MSSFLKKYEILGNSEHNGDLKSPFLCRKGVKLTRTGFGLRRLMRHSTKFYRYLVSGTAAR